jgi:hypothetical protein
MQWLMRLPQLPPNDLPAIHEIQATVDVLSEPCDPTWCMARVAALLSPYYDKDTPQGVRRMEAEDWLEALQDYPQWAIERAVRWWKSADNDHRRKKPLEGDIAARCKVEMRGIGSLPDILRRKIDQHEWISSLPKQEPQPERKPVDRETANAIVASFGFAPKRFGKN